MTPASEQLPVDEDKDEEDRAFPLGKEGETVLVGSSAGGSKCVPTRLGIRLEASENQGGGTIDEDTEEVRLVRKTGSRHHVDNVGGAAINAAARVAADKGLPLFPPAMATIPAAAESM